MANGAFTEHRADMWLQDLAELWISLHYSDPEVSGHYASEVFGGSYGRVKAEFSEPTGRVIFNVADIWFKSLPDVKITHIGAWDSQFNGNMEFSVALDTAQRILEGKSFRISSDSIAVSLP